MQAGMLSIEAKMAKLLPCDHIDTESQIWKELPSFKSCDYDKLVEYKDYVKISESRRSFVLDDVELGNDYVLTSVKFIYENGFNKLAARGHKFDFMNGTIDTTQEIWVVSANCCWKNETSRILPTILKSIRTMAAKKNETIVQFVKLMTSSSETDVGQSVVPFIHKVPVVPKHLLPLSGVGLIHTSNKKSAGYLALKIIGYDFEPQISKPPFYKS
uniref:Uncharacterized protein n=1 Tax=Trichogramma kaykai TaxID=54128 RepID=A0ABD2WG27_9HYME